ncbi:hypothetical protein L248_2338 [Schleiferilactobacillus shenzhenensis LY-73]|uniref:Uncharacterized protein n=2 Tax=Schleiferilactobacillus shenzhenensis TaxID=1231337 RepID=U4TW89_9LACO|nr:hypothetical protein L248_2338 [Schleiferilactobacillus shenzhenensis LY-73]
MILQSGNDVDQWSPEQIAEALANPKKNVDIHADYTAEAQRRVALIRKVGTHFALLGHHLELTATDDALKRAYGLTDADLSLLKEIVGNYNAGSDQFNDEAQTRAYIKGGNLYLSFMEVEGIVGSVAVLGPAAIAAALSAAMSVVPGAGTIVGAVVGFFGAGAIASALMNAAAHKKGIRIGISGIAAVKY